MAPSRLDFTVEHDSLKIEVGTPRLLEGQLFEFPSLGTGVADKFKKIISILSRWAVGNTRILYSSSLAWNSLDTSTLLLRVFIVETWSPSYSYFIRGNVFVECQ